MVGWEIACGGVCVCGVSRRLRKSSGDVVEVNEKKKKGASNNVEISCDSKETKAFQRVQMSSFGRAHGTHEPRLFGQRPRSVLPSMLRTELSSARNSRPDAKSLPPSHYITHRLV